MTNAIEEAKAALAVMAKLATAVSDAATDLEIQITDCDTGSDITIVMHADKFRRASRALAALSAPAPGIDWKRVEEVRARHEQTSRGWATGNWFTEDGEKAHADRATLLRALDEAQEELSIWQSVFPDIAPDRVLPDRSKLEAELLAMAEENARLKEALNERIKRFAVSLLEQIAEGIATKNDVECWLEDARAALKETGSFTDDPFNRAVLGLEPGQ